MGIVSFQDLDTRTTRDPGGAVIAVVGDDDDIIHLARVIDREQASERCIDGPLLVVRGHHDGESAQAGIAGIQALFRIEGKEAEESEITEREAENNKQNNFNRGYHRRRLFTTSPDSSP